MLTSNVFSCNNTLKYMSIKIRDTAQRKLYSDVSMLVLCTTDTGEKDDGNR
jgi:hypothetical protein